MAAETSAPAAPAATTKPVKPDEAAFKDGLARLEREHKAAQEKLNAVKAKIDLASGKNKENPTQQRRQELIAQANEIRKKQGVGKNARTAKMDEIKRLDEQLRSRINEQKTARSKVPYKSTEEIDEKIERLERDVNSGTMKLVDEKKALAEVSSLRRLRKTFAQFDSSQKAIDDLKAKIKEIKDSMEDPEAKALSEQYNKIQAEIDAIKAEQDEAYKNLSALRDERTKLHAAQEQAWQALKKHKDDYHTQRKANLAWEREQREKRREREQAERERIAKERKMERAKQMLADASEPAFLEEIRCANSLLHFFDPKHAPVEKAPLLADKGLAATAQRKVDDSGLTGMRLVRKEDRDDDYMPAVKKGKKGKGGKKAGADAADAATASTASSSSSKFSCPPKVIEDCGFIGVNPPMAAAEVPEVMEKIKAKLDQWKADQPEQTRKNIEKAKKEIERLEAEEAGEAGSGASTPNGVNGKKEADKPEAAEEKKEKPEEEKKKETPKAEEVKADA
ncbi:multicopy suppressor of BFA (Brefeldin A) [Madurella fahalii]|uniref:Multicopy suppressor of BFA (Brefeldin A) n=1 Tax=Madurella fahalii TaxID=1157608 RepID=A0ABQ0GLY3_9PEZI